MMHPLRELDRAWLPLSLRTAKGFDLSTRASWPLRTRWRWRRVVAVRRVGDWLWWLANRWAARESARRAAFTEHLEKIQTRPAHDDWGRPSSRPWWYDPHTEGTVTHITWDNGTTTDPND